MLPCFASLGENSLRQQPVALSPTNHSKLFSIPVPSSPLLDFESGKHQIAVIATEPDGIESTATSCTTWIVIT